MRSKPANPRGDSSQSTDPVALLSVNYINDFCTLTVDLVRAGEQEEERRHHQQRG